MIRKTLKRYGKYADIEQASVSIWHLIKSQFPGLSFERDKTGKIILRQNDGTLLPLENLPTILYGKNAEIIIKNSGVYVGQKRILNFVAGSGVNIEIQEGSQDTIDIVISSGATGQVNQMTIPILFEKVTWIEAPQSGTELLGKTYWRTKADLSSMTQTRIVVNVLEVGSVSFYLKGQYSVNGSDWFDLVGVQLNDVGIKVSNWTDLVSGAKSDVFLRVVGYNGGNLDVTFSMLMLQFR